MSPSILPNTMTALAQELRGQKLHVPDMWNKFAHWPFEVNCHLEDLRAEVDRLVKSVTGNTKILKAIGKSDMGLLTCVWFPHAEWDQLKAAAAYLVWVFVWDDEIDLAETETAKSATLGREYCERSLDYIKESMGLGKTAEGPMPYPSMEIFNQFGHGLRDGADEDQRWRTYRGLELYIDQVVVEHKRQLEGSMPTSVEYFDMRY